MWESLESALKADKPDKPGNLSDGTWSRLLGREGLLARALAAIRSEGAAPPEAWRDRAEDCWARLGSDDLWAVLERACLIPARNRFVPRLPAGTEPGRIRRNARRHLAAGLAAAWLTRWIAHPDAPAQLALWLSRAAELPLGEELTSDRMLTGLGWSTGVGDRLEQVLKALPPELGNRPLLSAWLHHLCGLSSPRPGRSLRVPIAAFEDGPSGGMLYTLDLDLLGREAGPPSLLESPASWNRPLAGDFLEVVEAAFRAAGTLPGPVVWSATPWPRTGPPDGGAALLAGRSHEAAARVAFRALADGLDYDPGVLISARVDADELVGVEGLEAKCEAALHHEGLRIDRIVIAPASKHADPTQAQAVIDGYGGRLTVQECATLAEATEVATGRPAALRRYLEWVASLPERDPPPYLGGRDFAELLVEPEVLKQVRRGSQEGEAGGGPTRLGVHREAEEVRLYFAEEECGRERVAWSRESRGVRHAVVVGLPGSGKSVLARMTARDAARRGLERLDAGVPAGAVELPACLHLADLADKDLEAALRDALVGVGDGLRDAAVAHLVERIAAGPSCLVLDALDEVPDSRRPGLLRRLADLAEGPSRVVLTTRPFGYRATDLPFRSIAEYQLAPLGPKQREDFLGAWFRRAPNSEHVNRIRRLLAGGPALAELGRNPLLLTLTCAVSKSRGIDPKVIRRRHVYRFMVQDLLRGAWKTRSGGEGIGQEEEELTLEELNLQFRALAAMAYGLYEKDLGRTVFRDEECAHLLHKRGKDFTDTRVAQLLGRWRRVGLLPATIDPHSGDTARFFVHRSFLEYLAAEHAAMLPDPSSPDPAAVARRYLWQPDPASPYGYRWTPEAEPFLVHLASCLDEPRPLLEEILRAHEERPDALGVMIRLAGLCLADTSDDLDEALIRRITEEGFRLWEALHGMPENGRHLGHRHGIRSLIDRLREEVRGEHPLLQRIGKGGQQRLVAEYLVRTLGELGHESALEPLSETLRLGIAIDNDINEYRWHMFGDVRKAAALALGRLGNEHGVPPLLQFLQDDGSSAIQVAAARDALHRLCDERTLDLLIAIVEKEKVFFKDVVRETAALILGQLGDERAVDPLLKMANESHEIDSLCRESAVYALGRLADERALEELRLVSRYDPEENVRSAAYWACVVIERRVEPVLWCLRETGQWPSRLEPKARDILSVEQAIDALLEAFHNEDTAVRRDAASLLGNLGDERALKPLLIALNTESDANVRWAMVRSVGKFADIRASDMLRGILLDQAQPEKVRHAAARALLNSGDETVMETALKAFSNGLLNRYEMVDVLTALYRRPSWLPRASANLEAIR